MKDDGVVSASLGVVLWESITGRRLFDGDGLIQVLNAVREQEIPLVSSVVKGMTQAVNPILTKALRRAPGERYQQSQDPELAARAANRLAELFIEASAMQRQQTARGTSNFLGAGLARKKEELAEREGMIAEFKRQHQNELPRQQQANLRVVDSLKQEPLGEGAGVRSTAAPGQDPIGHRA